MTQQVNLLLNNTAFHIRVLVKVLAVPLPIQIIADMPRKAVEDGPCVGTFATHVSDPEEATGS